MRYGKMLKAHTCGREQSIHTLDTFETISIQYWQCQMYTFYSNSNKNDDKKSNDNGDDGIGSGGDDDNNKP